MAVTRVYFYAAPPLYLKKAIGTLFRLLNMSKEVERVVLSYFVIIARTYPNILTPYYSYFLVCMSDVRQVKQTKISLLICLITNDTHIAILNEFIDYADDLDDVVVSDAIRGIGHCARLVPESTHRCLDALVTMIQSGHEIITANALIVLKQLLQAQLSSPAPQHSSQIRQPLEVIAQLARKIDDIRHARARACVIWLVGQYSMANETAPPSASSSQQPEGVVEWAPDVLRKVAKTFQQEVSPLLGTSSQAPNSHSFREAAHSL